MDTMYYNTAVEIGNHRCVTLAYLGFKMLP